MMKIGIIGYGYWGPNLTRNFNSLDDCEVKWIIDSRKERLDLVNKTYPAIHTSTNKDDLMNDNGVDGLVVATPVFLHYELGKEALNKGKHVMIEKPMTTTSQEAEELIELAQKQGKVLMVDHTFLYTGAVNKIKELVDQGEIGNVQYFDSTRINLGLFQPDINVIWDLAPHDLSILYHLTDVKPYSIIATGIAHTNTGMENIAYLTIKYNENKIAHFNCSWTSPVKIRRILIGGDEKMVIFDDVEPTEKVKVYDTGYNVQVNSDEDRRNILVDYRVGDIYIPKVEKKEALAGVASDFLEAIETGKEPVSNWESGLDVVKILEASDESLKNDGKEIILDK